MTDDTQKNHESRATYSPTPQCSSVQRSHLPRKLFVLTLLCLGATPLFARMWITVYLANSDTPIAWADPNVPYVYPEIMAGTKLSLIVSSDTAGPNYISLLITEPYWPQGQLFGRGYTWWEGPYLFADYSDSLTTAAGDSSVVGYVPPGSMNLPGGRTYAEGFDLEVSIDAIPGPWMILDYNSFEPGEMVINSYVYNYNGIPQENDTIPPPSLVLLEQLIIPQVPSRDYNQDTIVSFQDFAWLSQRWRESAVEHSEEPSAFTPFDLDQNQVIGPNDLHLFTEFWMVRTQGTDPNLPDPEMMFDSGVY